MAVVESTDIQRSPLVKLSGVVDSSSSDRVGDVMGELLELGCVVPRMDLTGVSSIDCDGVHLVAKWRQHFRDNESDLEVISVNPLVRKRFEDTGCHDIVKQSEELAATPHCERQPITDCLASLDGWEIRSFNVPATLDSSKIARERVAQMVERTPFAAEERDDIKIAVGEAATNAIKHGCRENSWEKVSILCIAEREMLTIEVRDPGTGFELNLYKEPNSGQWLTESGMGILIMRRCMDEVSFDFSVGTMVRLVKYTKP